MQNAHVTTRFLQLSDAVVTNANCQFREMPSALRSVLTKAVSAGFSVAQPPTVPVNMHEEGAKKKDDNDEEDVAKKEENTKQPATTLFAHFRWDELLEVGCSVDCSSPAGSNKEKATPLRFTSFDPRTRCAHVHFSVLSPEQMIDDDEKLKLQHPAVATGEAGPSLEQAFRNFTALFRDEQLRSQDPTLSELAPSGEFFVVVPNSDDMATIELYAVLASEPPAVPIVLDHDAGVDDLLALMLLASAAVRPLRAMPRKIDLIGTTVLDADCFAKPAGELCRRALCLFHSVAAGSVCKVPVGVSPLSGAAHPFPDEWRKDCIAMLDLPCLHTRAVNAAMRRRAKAATGGEEHDGDGHEMLARLVMDSPRPVTIVVTGPLTNVAYALRKYGERFARNVREVSIMGGAVWVPGNVINANLPKTAGAVDGSAEWNLYWDAPSAKEVLESPLLRHKLLYSTDATNHVPVTSEFVRRFGGVTYSAAEKFSAMALSPASPLRGAVSAAPTSPLSAASRSAAFSSAATPGSGFACVAVDLLESDNAEDDDDDDEHGAGAQEDPALGVPTQLANFFASSWAQTTFLKYLFGDAQGYFAWDVLSAAGVLVPNITRYRSARVGVEAVSGSANEGRTVPYKADEQPGAGGMSRVAVAIDAKAFYNMVLECATLC